MEVSEDTLRPAWYDKLAVEHAVAIPAFYDLVKFTAEVCLNEPERLDSNRQLIETSRHVSSETALLRRLGLWGVRNALEISKQAGKFDFSTKKQDDEPPQYISADMAVLWPKGFSGELDPKIQNTIEALGKSILEEAFTCLGDDALCKVEEYQKAETQEKQQEIIQWLVDRVHAITTRNGNEDEESNENTNDDSTFYHPARLSPKFIGKYPEVKVSPTCLGVSILVASFMEKAQQPYLHAGVAQSDTDEARQDYLYMLHLAREEAENLGVPLPDEKSERLKRIEASVGKAIAEDRGYHAAVLVRLMDNEWVQIDPNFGRNVKIDNTDMVACLDEGYEDLQHLGKLLPGTEMMIHDRLTSGNLLMELSFLKSVDKSPSLEDIDDYLKSTEAITCKDLADHFILPFFAPDNSDGLPDKLRGLVMWYLESFDKSNDPAEDEEHYYEKIMQDTIKSHIFPDAEKDGIERCIARCRTDDAYRQRRAEDLKLAPLFFMTKLAYLTTNSTIKGDTVTYHPRLEIGLPAYRVGASILSDFSVYCGDELPPSFWLTYWPSQVTATEHIPAPDHPNRRQPILNNVMGLMDLSVLRYIKSYGIIDEYLEQEYGTKGEAGERE